MSESDARCSVCYGTFTDEEWEDRHTPDDEPLEDCHSDCCENDDCKENVGCQE